MTKKAVKNKMTETAKQILSITKHTDYTTGITCSVLFLIVMIICIFVLEYGIRTQMNKYIIISPVPRIIQIIFGVLFVFAGIYLYSAIITVNLAKDHGMYQNHMTWESMISHIEQSPTEDRLPKDLSDTIILYYKFGCEDCENVYTEIQNTFLQNKDIYWISTRSEQGKILRKIYPIAEVPTGVYITKDLKPVVCKLYKKTQNKVIFHEENAQLLLSLYHSSHTQSN